MYEYLVVTCPTPVHANVPPFQGGSVYLYCFVGRCPILRNFMEEVGNTFLLVMWRAAPTCKDKGVTNVPSTIGGLDQIK